MTLVALVLIAMSSARQPTHVVDPPRADWVQRAPAPTARPLTPEQKAWFAHAIDHILDGK